MTDIVAFLTARYDEDERDARATMEPGETGAWAFVQARDGELKVIDGLGWTVADWLDGQPWPVGPHIARHDPARVLRKVAAERAILAAHDTVEVPNIEDTGRINACTTCGETQDHWYATPWPCDTLKHLAAVYADHPDYDPAWAVA